MRALLIGCEAWRAPFTQSLAAVGIGAGEAADVEEAGDHVASVDCAFVDCSGGDPLRAVSTLWSVAPGLPVVFSGAVSPDLIEAAREAGIPVVGPCPAPAYLAAVLDCSVVTRPVATGQMLAHATLALCELGASANPLAGDAAVEIIAQLFSADVVSIMLVGEDGVLRTVANFGHGKDVVGRAAPPHGLGNHILKSGAARLIIGDSSEVTGTSPATNTNVRASLMAPIRGAGGDVRGVLAVGKCRQHAVFTPRDLEVATALATLLGELLARADADREAQVLERRLAATERLTLLGELAAGVVHDVSSPLGAVRSNVEILIGHLAQLRPTLEDLAASSRDLDDMLEDLPSLLCESYEGLSRATDVIRQMRQVVRLGSTGAGEAVDVAAAIESAVRMLRSRVRIPVSVIVEERAFIRGVAVDMLQAITNLIANANDACVEKQKKEQEAGRSYKPQIVVELRKPTFASAGTADEVVVVVRDNGSGMSPEVLARMWEKLFTTKPVGQGTGLGMGIVQRVVSGHGGRVEVSSVEGEGTELRLTFPRERIAIEPRAMI